MNSTKADGTISTSCETKQQINHVNYSLNPKAQTPRLVNELFKFWSVQQIYYKTLETLRRGYSDLILDVKIWM